MENKTRRQEEIGVHGTDDLVAKIRSAISKDWVMIEAERGKPLKVAWNAADGEELLPPPNADPTRNLSSTPMHELKPVGPAADLVRALMILGHRGLLPEYALTSSRKGIRSWLGVAPTVRIPHLLGAKILQVRSDQIPEGVLVILGVRSRGAEPADAKYAVKLNMVKG